MNIISITLLSIIVSVSLFARPNPFEPTDQYVEEKALLEQEQKKELQIKKEQAQQLKIAEAFEAQQKLKELETQKMAPEKKDMNLSKATKKPYIPTVEENFKVLSFVKISVKDNLLTIYVDPQYTLLNEDLLKPEKKFLFDFKGIKSFYTVRNTIISDHFESFAVGTHMEEGFFRVVINLTDTLQNYSEKIDSEKGIITIQKK